MLDPSSLHSVSNILALPDLAFETDIGQPEILHAKDPVSAIECRIELRTVIHVAGYQLCAHGSQFLRGRLFSITRQRADLPAICQKFSRHGSALLTGCTGDCNYFIVHLVPLWFSISVSWRSHSFASAERSPAPHPAPAA